VRDGKDLGRTERVGGKDRRSWSECVDLSCGVLRENMQMSSVHSAVNGSSSVFQAENCNLENYFMQISICFMLTMVARRWATPVQHWSN
jgi:hypothetical protein